MVSSQAAGFQNIDADSLLEQAARTRGMQQQAGAGIVESTFRDTNADEVRERLEGLKKQGAANIEAARAQATETQGQQNVQQGGVQQQIGQTMVQTGTALLAAGAATFGTTAYVGLGLIATGTATSLMGGQQQQQGQQQVEAAPAYQSQANNLTRQSEAHFSEADQLRSQAESEAQEAAVEDPNGATTQGQQKGYFVGDNLADASSSDSDDKSTMDKLRDGMREINSRGGTSNDEELVADASSEGADGTNRTLADKLKDSSNTIAAMTGHRNVDDDATQSLETKKESVG